MSPQARTAKQKPSLDSQAAQAEPSHARKAAPDTHDSCAVASAVSPAQLLQRGWPVVVPPLRRRSPPLSAFHPSLPSTPPSRTPPSRSPPRLEVGSEPTRPSHPPEAVSTPKTRPGCPPSASKSARTPATTPLPSPSPAPITASYNRKHCPLYWPSSPSGDSPRLRRPISPSRALAPLVQSHRA